MQIENACVLEESAKPPANAIWKELSLPCSWGFKCCHFHANVRVYSGSCKEEEEKKTIRFHSDELQGNWKVPGSFLLAVFNSREYGREGVFVGTVYLML